MKTLASGGTVARKACGSTTWVIVPPNVSPIARAASACPSGTALIPERIASATKVDVYSVRARQARKKNELMPSSSTERNRIPSFGRPMMTKTKTISSGVLRTTRDVDGRGLRQERHRSDPHRRQQRPEHERQHARDQEQPDGEPEGAQVEVEVREHQLHGRRVLLRWRVPAPPRGGGAGTHGAMSRRSGSRALVHRRRLRGVDPGRAERRRERVLPERRPPGRP